MARAFLVVSMRRTLVRRTSQGRFRLCPLLALVVHAYHEPVRFASKLHVCIGFEHWLFSYSVSDASQR